MDASYLIGEFLTLGTMAVALSMDAFSVGLGMGMFRLRLRRIALIGLFVGFFHLIMPLGGILIGKALSVHFGKIATMAGGIILIMLGIEMVHSSLWKNKTKSIAAPFGIGLLFFSLTVSLDSFSVGLSLGIFGARVIVTVILFGVASMLFTWCGLILGRKFQRWLGAYSEVFGGGILLAFGLKLLFPL